MANAAWILGGRIVGSSGAGAKGYTLVFDVAFAGNGSITAAEVVVSFSTDDTETQMRKRRSDAVAAAAAAAGYPVVPARIVGLD